MKKTKTATPKTSKKGNSCVKNPDGSLTWNRAKGTFSFHVTKGDGWKAVMLIAPDGINHEAFIQPTRKALRVEVNAWVKSVKPSAGKKRKAHAPSGVMLMPENPESELPITNLVCAKCGSSVRVKHSAKTIAVMCRNCFSFTDIPKEISREVAKEERDKEADDKRKIAVSVLSTSVKEACTAAGKAFRSMAGKKPTATPKRANVAKALVAVVADKKAAGKPAPKPAALTAADKKIIKQAMLAEWQQAGSDLLDANGGKPIKRMAVIEFAVERVVESAVLKSAKDTLSRYKALTPDSRLAFAKAVFTGQAYS